MWRNEMQKPTTQHVSPELLKSFDPDRTRLLYMKVEGNYSDEQRETVVRYLYSKLKDEDWLTMRTYPTCLFYLRDNGVPDEDLNLRVQTIIRNMPFTLLCYRRRFPVDRQNIEFIILQSTHSTFRSTMYIVCEAMSKFNVEKHVPVIIFFLIILYILVLCQMSK
ncbi:unnamed protein product [Auanema sp. JU1783]|nr:unnamed protein product [Auanema sp. JU1783]